MAVGACVLVLASLLTDLDRYSHVRGQSDLGHTERLEELLDDRDIVCVASFPAEDDPPLVVDSDTVSAFAVGQRTFFVR